MTGAGFEETAEAGEENGLFHRRRERGGFGPFVLHQGLLTLQRNINSADTREP